MSKSRVKRLETQLADEPRERLVETIDRQQHRIEALEEFVRSFAFQDCRVGNGCGPRPCHTAHCETCRAMVLLQ